MLSLGMLIFNSDKHIDYGNVVYAFATVDNPYSIRYVGQTRNFKRRMSQYRRVHKARTAVELWVRYHGWGNIIVHILEVCPNISDLDSREAHWIEFYQTYRRDNRLGLNCTMGGSARLNDKAYTGSSKLSEEEVQNIREEYHSSRVGTRELADKYGVSKTTIAELLSRRSWKNLPLTTSEHTPRELLSVRGIQLTDSQKEELIVKKAAGVLVKTLCAEYGISSATCYRIYRSHK